MSDFTPPKDEGLIRTEYVPITLAVKWIWLHNPKDHDIGQLVESIVRYGFQDPPKYNAELENVSGGLGALSYGNGRTEALAMMASSGDYDRPKGIGILEDGTWTMPVKFGVDLKPGQAQAFAIDHNNLTLVGGDFTGFDFTRLYDDSYTELLTDLAKLNELPVSVDGDMVDALSGFFLTRDEGLDEVEFKEYDESVAGDVEMVECPNCGQSFPK